MKTVPVIVCVLVLAGIQITSAQAPASGTECAARACCECGQASCCAARGSPEPQPAPAAPVFFNSQNQITIPATAVPAWTLPDREARPCSFPSFATVTTAGVPLYARNCARLI